MHALLARMGVCGRGTHHERIWSITWLAGLGFGVLGLGFGVWGLGLGYRFFLQTLKPLHLGQRGFVGLGAQ